VRRVPVEGSRPLVTVGPESRAWEDPRGFSAKVVGDLTGAIVRVRPPAGATAEDARLVREAVERLGAHRVRLLPAPRVTAVVARREPAARRSVRRVVEGLVASASTEDRPALAAAVERALAAAGL
jgi:hypothetical protein